MSETGNESVNEPKPWTQSWNDNVIEPVKDVVNTVKQAITGPWDKDWSATRPKPEEAPVAPSNDLEGVYGRMITQESGGRHTDASGNLITSSAGAKGISQLMPNTGDDPGYGVTPLKNKTEAEYKRFGKDYLNAMVGEFGDITQAVAAYNAGPGRVKDAIAKAAKNGGNWVDNLPSETKKYIKKVLK